MKIVALIFSIATVFNVSVAFAYDPQGSGKISDGNCTCKSNCDQFARAGQLAGPKLAQCKSDCAQKYAGCNKGAQR